MQRKYQAIWERVKKERSCTIEVHPLMQARVKKAVIKEKLRDLAFKVLNDHDYFYLNIAHVCKLHKIEDCKEEFCKDKQKECMKFELKQRLGLEGVVQS